MIHTLSAALLVSLGAVDLPQGPEFSAPVRLQAGGEAIDVEEPGYASPAFADVNGDGHGDLVVGQFNGGKMKVYAGDGKGVFATGQWLEAGGDVAEVPGVW